MYLLHSAKGSIWKEHKYIQRKNGTYYYPDSYEGGRHLPDGSEEDPTKGALETTATLSETDIERLAREVIRGNFANGQERRELLGEAYRKVQDRVNQIMKSNKTKVSEVKEFDVEKVDNLVKKIDKSSINNKPINLETVYQVYRKRK